MGCNVLFKSNSCREHFILGLRVVIKTPLFFLILECHYGHIRYKYFIIFRPSNLKIKLYIHHINKAAIFLSVHISMINSA